MKVLFAEYGRFIIALIAAVIVVPVYNILGEAYRTHSEAFIAQITGAESQYIAVSDDSDE